MTPTRFRQCLDALHWTQRGLARILNRPEGTVRQWARGAVRIPGPEAAWLEFLAVVHQKMPPPRREWRDVIDPDALDSRN